MRASTPFGCVALAALLLGCALVARWRTLPTRSRREQERRDVGLLACFVCAVGGVALAALVEAGGL